MNPVVFALRRPLTVIVGIIAVLLAAGIAIRPKAVDQQLGKYGLELPLKRMPVDIFPALNLPVIYVCQPYGGMDPAQMEGLITNYYEYHFLYISGIHHVESKNVQGNALMKLHFHPGTNMAQAMAETINYVNRSRAFMPPGTVSPFVMRFDTGSVPVGYLVLSSETRTIAEIQDLALFKVRPMFSSLPGVSAPPPFGGSARTIVLRVDPDRLRAYGVSADDVITALTSGNTISPSGNLHVGDSYPIVSMNAMVREPRELGSIPVRAGTTPSVYLRDLATIEDSADIAAGYALVNGRRAVYILATKRSDASTLSVIEEIKRALPSMQKELPDDINVSFEFDQSPYVTRAIESLFSEGALGALLTGLMVLIFLRDWRSALVVVLNIPLAIAAAIVGLWLCGQTINLMTLGGLALAVGILVDEATVEIENIHSQLEGTDSVALAVRRGNSQTAIPRLLAMLCILAVFVPSFFMTGAARELFVPLSLAVGFAMIASYVLSSTFVPVLSTWLLKHHGRRTAPHEPRTGFGRFLQFVGRLFSFNLYRDVYARFLGGVVMLRWVVVPAYFAVTVLLIVFFGNRLGTEIFPQLDAGEFRLRLRAPDGTHIEKTEQISLEVLEHIKQKVGPENVALSLGYVGMIPASFPINAVYQFSRGPEEAMIRIALRPHSGISTESLKETLRRELPEKLPDVRFSFEPADIVSDVMSFGSPTPIEIAARGGSVAENRAYLDKVQQKLSALPEMRDVQLYQSLDYPTVEVKLDREKAGKANATAGQVARSVLAATASSRFVVPNYWPDPKTGVGYQVQVEVPQPLLNSMEDLGAVPVRQSASPLLLRDVATLSSGTMPGQFDRYNMKREVSLTANLAGADLGRSSVRISQALDEVKREYDAATAEAAQAGKKLPAISHELRGQIPPMRQMISGLGIGLLLAILVIFLLLTANFQSLRLAFTAVAAAPAVIAGVLAALYLTGSTLNIQSFIGAIMAIGVAMANAILLITFAEQARRGGLDARAAAVDGGQHRLRAILMTSCAMLAGMLPLALAWGEAGPQTAPLGRAVMGGLIAATLTTLVVLPALFALLQSTASRASASLDPADENSRHFVAGGGALVLCYDQDFGCSRVRQNAGRLQKCRAVSRVLANAATRKSSCNTALVTLLHRFVGCLLIGLLAAGCAPNSITSPPPGNHVVPTAPADQRNSAMRVATIAPARKTLIRRVEQPGEVHAFEQTPLFAKVTGFLSKIHVDIGDRVEKDKLLAEISIPEYAQELKQKQALVAQAAAETTQAKAAIKVAESALISAQALAAEATAGVERREAEFLRANSELERIKELFNDKAVTQKLLDEAQAAQRAANAARTEAKARITSTEAVVAEKEAGIEQAQADALAIASKEEVAQADEQRLRAIHEYTKITAPYDSIVTERNVDTGHLVQSGKAAEKPLFVVVQAGTVRIFVDVPEADAGLVAAGNEASIRVPSAANRVIAGKVAPHAWLLHPTTRTLRAEIDVANADGTLRPGMYVIADLKVAERTDVFALPRTAILMKEQQAAVLVVDGENKIVRLPIVTGVRAGEEVEVVSGLQGDERIIPANVAAYREGQTVEVVAPPQK